MYKVCAYSVVRGDGRATAFCLCTTVVGGDVKRLLIWDSGVILSRVSFHGRFVHFHTYLPSYGTVLVWDSKKVAAFDTILHFCPGTPSTVYGTCCILIRLLYSGSWDSFLVLL